MKDSIAIITARGGSKRIPRKNVRFFRGKPMIYWPVSAAVESGLFEEIIISTDDREIAAAAMEAGAKWPFTRPPELADDMSGTADVLKHDLARLKEQYGALPPYCCCLYGTSAFATHQMLQDAHKLLEDGAAELVLSVINYNHPIERALQFNEEGYLVYRQPEFVPVRTQDIAPSFYDAAQFYFFDIGAFAKKDFSFVPLRRKAIELSPLEAADIDTEEDWLRAETIASFRLGKSKGDSQDAGEGICQ